MAATLASRPQVDILPAVNGCHEARQLPADLPQGFPARIDSSLAWKPDEVLARRDETILQLTEGDLVTVNEALTKFKESNLDLYQLCPVTFPLPGLSARLAKLKRCLHEGPGFFTIRGLTPSKWDARENLIIHTGITSYFGTKRALQQSYMSRHAEALLHVCDIKQDIKNIREDVFLAPGNQSISIGFHSDNGDNVSLYCRQIAASGGDLYLASAWKIYNELASHHMDVLSILAAPWQWQLSRLGEEQLLSTNAPLFYFHGNKLVVNYQKRPLRGTKEEPRDSRLKPLTLQQQEALNTVDMLAHENAISVQQQAGDMNFFNNLAILHARSAFVDGDDKIRRHLTRIIFRDEVNGWDIPDGMKEDWEKYYGHDPSVEIFREDPTPWAFSLSGHD